MNTINKFDGKYRFLSNFYPCKIELDGIRYPSVEHAFQAAKTLNIQERKNIAVCRSAADAKRIGRYVALRTNWDSIKVQVMLDLLRSKFKSLKLKQKLIDTSDSLIVEGNTWNDTFWGQCDGVGKNMLGKLLMQVRSEINESGDD